MPVEHNPNIFRPHAHLKDALPLLDKCNTRGRYDWNVFDSLWSKWSSGTAGLVVSGFRTGKTSAASAAKPSPYAGSDATAARGWRACSAKARSHEWAVLSTAGATRYNGTLITPVISVWFPCSQLITCRIMSLVLRKAAVSVEVVTLATVIKLYRLLRKQS